MSKASALEDLVPDGPHDDGRMGAVALHKGFQLRFRIGFKEHVEVAGLFHDAPGIKGFGKYVHSEPVAGFHQGA